MTDFNIILNITINEYCVICREADTETGNRSLGAATRVEIDAMGRERGVAAVAGETSWTGVVATKTTTITTATTEEDEAEITWTAETILKETWESVQTAVGTSWTVVTESLVGYDNYPAEDRKWSQYW